MSSRALLSSSLLLILAAACGGKSTPSPSEAAATPVASEDETHESEDAIDETGGAEWADWKSYTNVSPGAWQSKTHGNRFVEIYVNDIALEAYKTGGEMPVGSIVIKPSWENDGGKPGAEGPLFVMVKKEAGYAPDNGDWFYAFQWENPPEKWAAKIGTNVDWRSPSDKVEYCLDCHDVLERQLGMPPEERRAAW